tara:strand:- start:640 stop:1194 length:555 start_codon:yes stop_codon:yes gene_type:complete
MIKETLKEISKNFENLITCEKEINRASKIMIDALDSGGKIIYCGNGGSAADSQHLAAELVGRYRKNRQPLAAVALTTDTSIITAVGNDFSFEEIFSRQIQAIGDSKDVLYAISTSGKSKNIIKAITESKKQGIQVIGITGQKGHDMEGLCDLLICVPSNRPDRIQEMHIAVGQILCEIIENTLC